MAISPTEPNRSSESLPQHDAPRKNHAQETTLAFRIWQLIVIAGFATPLIACSFLLRQRRDGWPLISEPTLTGLRLRCALLAFSGVCGAGAFATVIFFSTRKDRRL